MKVRDLIAKLRKLPPDADVYVDSSSDYPETAVVEDARLWKDYPESWKESRHYGWSQPDDEDVFLW